MKPIAAPIVAGMITSTIHVLTLVPVFFAIMKERALRRGTLRHSEKKKNWFEPQTIRRRLMRGTARITLSGSVYAAISVLRALAAADHELFVAAKPES
jgi:hypothetical protein